MPFEDLNQSSRLDLDYDPDEEGLEESANCMTLIGEEEESGDDESQTRVSSAGSGVISDASSVESTVVVETVSDGSSEGLNGVGGQRREQQHQQQQYEEKPQPYSEINGFSSYGQQQQQQQYQPYQEMPQYQEQKQYEEKPQSYQQYQPYQKKPQYQEQQQYQEKSKSYQQYQSYQEKPQSYPETNGFSGRNGVKSNVREITDQREGGMERERTSSTLNTSNSSDNDGEGTASQKMIRIRLWDPGESSSSESYHEVTLAMEMLSKKKIVGNKQDATTILGVGQTIHLQRQGMGRGRSGHVDVGEKSVNITWQETKSQESRRMNQKQRESQWQPPLRLSKEEQNDARGNNIAHLMNNQIRQPLQDHDRRYFPNTSSIPKTEWSSVPKTDGSSIPKTEDSSGARGGGRLSDIPKSIEHKKEKEDLPTPVKGLEPFTIPSILTSTVIKRTPTEKVGLAFRKASGTVVIEKIVPGSAFDDTAVRPGYECLCINGHRLRSARRAAEIVRESGSSLTLMASNAPRPPGTMYTIISLDNQHNSAGRDFASGMHFTMKHGLVQLMKVDSDSPISSTSMKVGDFVLAINGSVVGTISKAVGVLSAETNVDNNDESLVPILYFNMRQLRVSLVDKVIGDLWKKEWSENYDECIVLQPGSESSNPLTLRFKEEGMCELLDPLRAFRDKSSSDPNNLNKIAVVPPDHPLNSVVETLNHGILCVLSAIKEGVGMATSSGRAGGGSKSSKSSMSDGRNKNGSHAASGGSGGDIVGELTKLTEMYRDGLLSKDDFGTIKSKLLKSVR